MKRIVAFRNFAKVPTNKVTNILIRTRCSDVDVYVAGTTTDIYVVLAVTQQLVSRCRRILS